MSILRLSDEESQQKRAEEGHGSRRYSHKLALNGRVDGGVRVGIFDVFGRLKVLDLA